MEIKSAEFTISNTEVEKCPAPIMPEYAFIGRSNVGKSSLINMLCQRNSMAKTSGKPGKTQLINHFLINKNWYLVDLPGYGFAQVGKEQREKWSKFIQDYILERPNLMCLMV
jgi:GTP-binding protein